MKTIQQQDIRYHNLKHIFTLVGEHKGISRAKLSRKTGLSKSTVSSLVDELLNEGLLVENELQPTGQQGRQASGLYVDEQQNVIAVLHWTANTLKLAYVSMTSQITRYREVAFRSNEDYIEQITIAYRGLSAGIHIPVPKVLAFVVIIPGIIDTNKQLILSNILPFASGEMVIARLRAAFSSIPLCIFNDSACFAYAEKRMSMHYMEPMIFLNLSQGVGAVLFYQGEILNGANGMTTQFGHFSVKREGKLCRCGNRGCLECRIGESELALRARSFMSVEDLNALGILNYETLAYHAEHGHDGCQRLLEQIASDLGFALGNFITLYHAERCIIGGSGCNLGDYFLKKLKSNLKKNGFRYFVEHCTLCYSQPLLHSEFIGASMLFISKYYRFGAINNELFLK